MNDESTPQPWRMDDLIDQYLTNLRVEGGVAGNTVQAYRRDLEKLQAYLALQGMTNPLDVPPHLTGFLNHLRVQQLSPASVSRCLAAIRGFYRFLSTEHGAPEVLSQLPGAPKQWTKLPKTLSESEVTALLELPVGQGLEDIRDSAMVELMYAAGLRVSELISLPLSAVNVEVGYVQATGKGEKQRMVPIGEVARRKLVAYCREVRLALLKGRSTSGVVCDEAGGCHDSAELLDHSPEAGVPSRHSQADLSAHVAPFVRHASAGTRRRFARRANDAGPRQHRHHPNLHARGTQAAEAGPYRAVPQKTTTRVARETGFPGISAATSFRHPRHL